MKSMERPCSRAQTLEQREDLRLHGDVECGGGFVGDEKARAVDERHGDHDALTLAAGELMRVVAETALRIGQGDFVQRGEHALVELGFCDAWVMCEDGFGDLAADAHDRVERGHGLLKDHRERAAAVRAHVRFR